MPFHLSVQLTFPLHRKRYSTTLSWPSADAKCRAVFFVTSNKHLPKRKIAESWGAAASEGFCHSVESAPDLGGVLRLPRPARQPTLGRVRVEDAEVSAARRSMQTSRVLPGTEDSAPTRAVRRLLQYYKESHQCDGRSHPNWDLLHCR